MKFEKGKAECSWRGVGDLLATNFGAIIGRSTLRSEETLATGVNPLFNSNAER